MADTFNNLAGRARSAILGGYAIARQFIVANFVSAPADPLPARRAEPRRLTLSEQWAYLTDIVMGAASRAEEAARCHVSATQQLDLAQYALSSVIDELSAVMDMGGRVRRRSTIHVFGTAQPVLSMPYGGAIAA
ncbi:hypothetical protein [Hyphomicrobium sp.]|uniref:hypothetical protein n=1 Tax=Hyphomicrobium sp. TaxID=82 RepID=UPI0025BD9054|nr:hypothetical protein [Hyphomicrobium sp.]